MTDQERQLIVGLADRMKSAPAPQVDREADALIQSTIGSRPDALYILTQTVLIQDMALKQAQGSFLPPAQPARTEPAYTQPGYAQSQYAGPPPPRHGGFSDFLHNAATTAAGVIAGEIAFDSLASLFGGRGGGSFFGGGGLMPGGETIVNNSYDDPAGGSGGDGDSQFAQAVDGSGDNLSPDIEDDRDNSGDDFSGGGDGS